MTTAPIDRDAELTGFLEWFRVLAAKKLEGLSDEDAVRVATPTGMTLLSIIKHLTWVERMWFQRVFLGYERSDVEHVDSFRLAPGDTVESVLSAYDHACEASRRVVADAASLDTNSVVEHWHFKIVTLHWIVAHMIEETARHVGHLDILREQTDGRTGD